MRKRGLLDRPQAGERLVGDGGWGTMLMARGLEAGRPPESLMLTRLEAGAQLITTNRVLTLILASTWVPHGAIEAVEAIRPSVRARWSSSRTLPSDPGSRTMGASPSPTFFGIVRYRWQGQAPSGHSKRHPRPYEPMNRTASRFALATLAGLATLLLPGASRAQSLQTVETPNYNTSGPQGQIRFKLQGPSSWVGKETFLVCYASVADDDQPWSKTLAAMVGAVARIRKEHDLGANPPKDWTLGITGVTATAPDGDYTVPRTLISKLATEVVWGSNQSHFVRPLQASGALAWPTTGWPSDTGSSMRWGSLTTSTSGVFDSVAVMRRCFTLQVAAWLDNKPETDPTVQAYVDSLMSIFWAEMIQPGTGANFDLNMVAVQIGAGVGGGPPVITLSLPRKVRIQSIGGGLQSRDAYLMLLDAFPINFDTVLRVPYSWNPNSAPPEGDYYFALPTINGYRLEPATLFQGVASVGFECTTPFDISPIPMAPFALYDAATNTYIEMAHDGPDPLVGYLIPTLPTPIY